MPDDSTRKQQEEVDNEGVEGTNEGSDRTEALDEHLQSLKLWNLYLDRKITLRQLIERLPGEHKDRDGTVESAKNIFEAKEL